MLYNGHNFDEVIAAHKEWIDSGYMQGNSEKRAMFSWCDCRGLKFDNLDLTYADFICAQLDECIFTECKIEYANFDRSNLDGAKFIRCRLFDASFANSSLIETEFRMSNLENVSFTSASLVHTKFDDYNNKDANSINWDCAELYGVDHTPYISMACPTEGSFIGWKKCRWFRKHCKTDGSGTCETSVDYVIVKLLIPEDAKRSSGTGKKCRCDRAYVLDIQDFEGNTIPDSAHVYSIYDPTFEYKIGALVLPKRDNFCRDRFQECASGIHFYIDRRAAVYHNQ